MVSRTLSLFLIIFIMLQFITVRSDPGWITLPSGTNEDLHSIHFFNADTGWAASRRSLLKTFDGGLSWQTMVIDTNNRMSDILFLSPDTGLRLSHIVDYETTGMILRTTDAGVVWDTLVTLPTYWFQSIFFKNSVTGWIGGCRSFVFPNTIPAIMLKTVDGGVTWSSPIELGGSLINSVFFTDLDKGYTAGLYLGMYLLWSYPMINKTLDGGLIWDYSFYPPVTSGRGELSSIYFYNQNIGWAVGCWEDSLSFAPYGITLKTIDGGSNWEIVGWDPKFEGECFNDVYFANIDTGWVVTYWGRILRSEDGGSNWEIQNNFVNSSLNDIFFLNPDTGWIAGDDGIILKTTSGGVTAIDSDPEEPIIIPEEILLFQNFPNPFNSTTEISFYLSENLPVTLEVFNIAGQRVATLLKGNMPIGRHTLNFQIDDLASGVYLYQLSNGNQFLRRKMVILK